MSRIVSDRMFRATTNKTEWKDSLLDAFPVYKQ